MRQVLSVGQSVGDVWTAGGGLGLIVLDSHAGGTWTLQIESPGGEWVATDVTFDDDGIKAGFVTAIGLRYRLAGGTAGARAWAAGAVR